MLVFPSAPNPGDQVSDDSGRVWVWTPPVWAPAASNPGLFAPKSGNRVQLMRWDLTNTGGFSFQHGVNCTIDQTYDQYVVEAYNLFFSVEGAALNMRVTTDNVNWISSTSYGYMFTGVPTASPPTTAMWNSTSLNNGTEIYQCTSGGTNAVPSTMTMYAATPWMSGRNKTFRYEADMMRDGGNNRFRASGTGWFGNGSPILGFIFYPNTGAITNVTAIMYGIAR
jgi:hypothetical protein